MHSWESKLTHINSLNIIEQSDSYQEFWMEVVSENSIVKAESNRFLYENLIYFYQPTPPQFLEKHGGYWEFLSDGDLTEIRLHHQWIESKESLSQLDCHNRTEARKKISEILKQHAYETLSKWKEILDEK